MQLLGTGPQRAGELAAAAGTSAPAMSRHLRVLLQAGIVADERTAQDARARVFRLRPQSMVALQASLIIFKLEGERPEGAADTHVPWGVRR